MTNIYWTIKVSQPTEFTEKSRNRFEGRTMVLLCGSQFLRIICYARHTVWK